MTSPESILPTSGRRGGILRRNRGKVALFLIIAVPALLFTLWAGITLKYTYASGERSGYVQKLSEKGWLCKTWEGELAMANLPGAMPQIFVFSVRGDSIAEAINQAMAQGGRVVLTYRQHVGVPTSCFGETSYFVEGVRITAIP